MLVLRMLYFVFIIMVALVSSRSSIDVVAIVQTSQELAGDRACMLESDFWSFNAGGITLASLLC